MSFDLNLLLAKTISEIESEKFEAFSSEINLWQDWLNRNGQGPVEASMRFALSQTYADKIIVGIENKNQFNNIINMNFNKKIPPEELSSNKLALLDPRKWT